MTSVAYGLAFPATRGVLAQHASGFDPTALFSGDTGGWWDVSDLARLYQDSAGTTPVTGADQPVGRIEDKSGNGNHLTQAAAAQRPMLRSGGGLWWLEFDGVDDVLAATFTLAQPLTQITAAQQVTWTSGHRLWSGTGSTLCALVQTAGTPNIRMLSGANGPLSGDMSVAVNHVVTEIFDNPDGATATKLAIDNGSYVTGDAGASDCLGATIGAATSGGALPGNILWFGAAWIGRLLSEAEIAQARSYFGAKAGLSL